MSAEVEGRLDSLFKEDNKESISKGFKSDPDNDPLFELKILVFSLEWEITDEVITDFLMHTNNLIEFYQNDRLILTFLHILRALGRYIDANRSKSHPDSIKALISAFSVLDHVVQSTTISLSEKEKLLKIEVDKYKKLRQFIIDMKLFKKGEKNQNSLVSTDEKIVKNGKTCHLQPLSEHNRWIICQSQLDELKREIMQILRSEFKSLKEELINCVNLGDIK